MGYGNYGNDAITFPQLVYGQIKKIQEICSKELRDGDKIIKNALGEQTIEGEDTRYSYLQSIDVLGSLLSSYFNDKIKKQFNEFVDICDIELIEAIEDKDFIDLLSLTLGKEKSKDLANQLKKVSAMQVTANTFLLNYKIQEARKMFRSLIKLFKDNGFLAQESFGDTGGAPADNGMDAFEEDEDGEDKK